MAKEQEKKTGEESPKSKKGLIIGIISAIVVAGGAVAAFLILNKSSSPENVALDAVTKTIKAPAHKINGKIELSTAVASVIEPNASNKAKITIEIDGENNNLDAASSATLTIKATGMSDFVFRFDSILQKDGVIYIKPSDLTAFINSIVSTYKDYLSVAPLSNIVSEVKSLAAKVSSNWWRISLPEVLEALGMKDKNFADEYECFVTTANTLAGESGRNALADTYKEHQFLNIKKSDKGITSFTGDVYEATVDTNKLVDFWNKYITSDQVKEMDKCSSEKVTTKTVTADKVPSISGTIFLDIDKDHNLKGIYLSESKDNTTVDADLRIENGSEDFSTSAPAGAKPITDLTNDVVKIVQSVMSLFSMLQTAE